MFVKAARIRKPEVKFVYFWGVGLPTLGTAFMRTTLSVKRYEDVLIVVEIGDNTGRNGSGGDSHKSCSHLDRGPYPERKLMH
jgi:hypothetical protein